MAINFDVSLNNRNLLAAVREAQTAMGKLSQAVEGVGDSVDDATSSIKEMIKQAAALGGISLGMAGVKEFLTQMISVRKEMQGFQISLDTLLGDKDRASAMFSELKDFAATTPLMLSSLAGGAQTMLGFDIAAERVIPTLKQIGDISMGDANKFNSLVLAFSQMSATGKLMGQDLLQMINAGFNPLTEISKKTGKSIAELKDEMSAGAISADMVAEAFASATAEGGKFYGMLSKQGEGLAGQINTLSGALNDMYNELAQSSEGAISTAVSGITTLVQNYDKVGKAIATIVTTYGAYKAALIATNIAQMANAAGWGMTLLSIKETIVATKAATVAQTLYNLAVKQNPYVLAATAIVAVAGAMWTFGKNANEAADAQQRINKSMDEFNKKQKDEKDAIQGLIQTIQSESATEKDRQDAYRTLASLSGKLADKYSIEELAVISLTKAYKGLADVQEEERMDALFNDTQRKINVYNNLIRIAKGRQRVGDAETQQFIQENGLVGMDSKKVREMLKKKIDEQMAELENYQQSKQKKEEKGNMQFKQLAETVLADFQDAKAYWEKIQKTGTVEAVQKAKEQMDKYDAEYEKLTGTKASSKSTNLSKRADQASKDAKALRELQERIAKEDSRTARDQVLTTEQARINAMKEGNAKVLAQIQLDYAKEKEAIKREEEDLLEQREKNARELWEAQNKKQVEQNPDAWVKTGAKQQWEVDYNTSDQAKADQDFFDERNRAALAKYKQSNQAQMQAQQQFYIEFLKEFGNFEQQKLAIAMETENKLAELGEDANEYQIEAIKRQGQKQIQEIEKNKKLSDVTSNESYIQALIDPSSVGKDGLKSLKEQLEQARESLKSLDPENLRVVTDLMRSINEEMIDTNPFETWKQGVEDYKASLSEVADAKVFLANAQVVKQQAKTDKELADAENLVQVATNRLTNAINKQTSAEATVIASKKRVADATSKVGEDIQQVGDIVGKFDDQTGTFIRGIGSLVTAVGNAVTFTSQSTAASIKAIESASVILAVISAAVQLAMAVANMLNSDKDYQKRIENIDKQINNLKKSYESLQDAADKTYSGQRKKNIEAEIDNLNRQNQLIQQQIRLEEKKKDTDQSAIEQYQDTIYENQKQINRLREQAKDAIFGSDMQTAIEDFATAYADAWTNNENRTRRAKDIVRDLMKKMVTESIKATIQASGAMEQIRQKMSEYFKDGLLSEAEQQAIYSEAEKLQQKLDQQFSWADDLFDHTQDFSSATAGGFATMSQESADELNGRFTTAQISIEGILQQTMLIYATGQQQLTLSTESNETLKDIKNLMITMGSNVEDIALYTRALTTFGEKFDQMNRQLAKL